MLSFLAVGIGGFIGCCTRYGITKLLALGTGSFPAATLIANVIAGVLIGFIFEYENLVGKMAPDRKLFLTTGLLGGLSTFSTFSLETMNLFGDGKYLLGGANVLLNLVLSFGGVVIGVMVARKIWS